MYEAAMKIHNRVLRAAFVAKIAHDKQRRKYNGRPYVTHPGRVASVLSVHPEADEDLICVGWLHDVLEDTWVSVELLEMMFGKRVAELVVEVTNPSKGMDASRKTRKSVDLDHLAKASKQAKLLKLIDRLDNLEELRGAPGDFKKLYSKESLTLAEVIGDADLELKKKLIDSALLILKG